jgi:hypothetical protein
LMKHPFNAHNTEFFPLWNLFFQPFETFNLNFILFFLRLSLFIDLMRCWIHLLFLNLRKGQYLSMIWADECFLAAFLCHFLIEKWWSQFAGSFFDFKRSTPTFANCWIWPKATAFWGIFFS